VKQRAFYSFVRSSCLTSAARRRGNRAVCLFLRFELLDECSEMPRHRTREGVVLVLQALPDCGEPNASIATGIELALALRGMGSVTVLN
jgi:hypothetical protein